MLLSQVESFLETSRHRNLSRAADALHVTQPALTARIQSLEAELGTALFVRGRHGMDLTDAGRAFLPYAERAMAALDAGASLLTELRRGGTGELVLGAAPAVSTYVLPALLVRYAREARAYSFVFAGAALAGLLLAELWQRPRRRGGLAYAAALWLLLATHYTGFWIAGAWGA